MATGGPLRVRSDDEDFGVLNCFGGSGENLETFGVDSVVIGDQDSHGMDYGYEIAD